MSTQQPGHQLDNTQREQRRKQPQWIRWLIASIIILLIVVGIIIWVVTSQNSFSTILPIVIFTVLGVIIALFQWLFPVSSTVSDHPSTTIHSSLIPQLTTATPSLSTMPQIVVDVPPAAHTHSAQSGPLDKRAYRGIMGVPPPTDPRTIQQRETVVKDIFSR